MDQMPDLVIQFSDELWKKIVEYAKAERSLYVSMFENVNSTEEDKDHYRIQIEFADTVIEAVESGFEVRERLMELHKRFVADMLSRVSERTSFPKPNRDWYN